MMLMARSPAPATTRATTRPTAPSPDTDVRASIPVGMLAGIVIGLLVGSTAPTARTNAQPAGDTIDLEIRVFDGDREITDDVSVRLHPAGRRDERLPEGARTDHAIVFQVPAGAYDAQIVQLEDGRVVGMRRADNITVAAYPDERGRHLEVLNFRSGWGAMQLREPDDSADRAITWEAMAFAPGARDRALGEAARDGGYALLVLPSGRYDVVVREDGELTWLTDLEVPPGRTALVSMDR